MLCCIFNLGRFAVGIIGYFEGHPISSTFAALVLWIILDEILKRFFVMPFAERTYFLQREIMYPQSFLLCRSLALAIVFACLAIQSNSIPNFGAH